MEFVITNGRYYIGGQQCGQKTLVTTLNKAFKYSNMGKAENELESAMRSHKGWSLQVDDTWYVSDVCDLRTTDTVEPIELDFDIQELSNDLFNKTEQLTKRKAYLNELIRQCDLTISDIEHCAEFYDLNACQGYKLYKMLHKTRVERREYKNEIRAIGYILSGLKCDTQIKNGVYGIYNNQEYKPRVFEELFDIVK